MAFVADYTDEDLKRALEAAGGTPAVQEGPGTVPAASGAPAGPAVPAPGAAPAGGPEAGTGFVNLSRYFDANQPSAGAMADQVLAPLGQNITNAVSAADAARQPLPDILPGATGNDFGDYRQDIMAGSRQQAAIKGKDRLLDQAKNNATSTVQGYQADPNSLAAALTGGGTKSPSSFDAYLTGAALPGAFQGFQDYFGGMQPTVPVPGASATPPAAPGSTPPVVTQKPPTSAADALAPPRTRPDRRRGGGTREP